MYNERKSFGYPPAAIRRDSEMYRMIETTNRNVGKIGFCVGILTVGGYFLYKKVKELSRECEKLKEMGK